MFLTHLTKPDVYGIFYAGAEQDTLQQSSSVAAEAVTGPRTATVRKCSKCKRPGDKRRNCTVSV